MHASKEVESVLPRERTGLGLGYFVTWVTTYRTDAGEVVGRQRFRILEFDPSTIDPSRFEAAR